MSSSNNFSEAEGAVDRADDPAPWAGLEVLCVIFIYVCVQFFVLLGFKARFKNLDLNNLPPATAVELPTFVNLGFVALAVPLLARRRGPKGPFSSTDREKFSRMVRAGALSGLAAFPLVIPINYLMSKALGEQDHPVAQMLRERGSLRFIVLAIFSAVVAAPLAEELLFRVVLLGWLDKVFNRRGHRAGQPISEPVDASSLNPETPQASRTRSLWDWIRWAGPNVTTSLLFASVHMWPTQIPLFILSLGFGWLYLRTRSWVACTAMHSVFNGINTCILCVYIGLGWGPSDKPAAEKDAAAIQAPAVPAPAGDE